MDEQSGIHRHGIRNPQRGIHNPRLSWITLYGAMTYVNMFDTKFSHHVVPVSDLFLSLFTLISCELYLSSPFVFPLLYKAGIIDLGNDTIYIEPVLNTSLIIHRGWTRPGRPHLVYRKAMLDSNEQHDLALDQFVGSGGYPTGLNGLYKIVINYILNCR